MIIGHFSRGAEPFSNTFGQQLLSPEDYNDPGMRELLKELTDTVEIFPGRKLKCSRKKTELMKCPSTTPRTR